MVFHEYYRPLIHIAIAFAVGLLLGFALIYLSPLLVLSVLAIIGLIYATLKRPEIGLLGILILTSSIVFENQLPIIPIGIGSLQIPDLILLSLLVLIILRRLVEPEFKIVRTPLDWPIILFFSIALLSTFIGILNSSVAVEPARRWIRGISYYLAFFTVTNLIREDRQIRLLQKGFILIATLAAAAMALQAVVGTSRVFLPGSIGVLNTQGVTYGAVTRIVIPGRYLVVVAFIALTSILTLEKIRLTTALNVAQWGMLGLGLLISFLRSYWAVVVLMILVMALLVRRNDRQRFILGGLFVLLLMFIFLLPFMARPESRVARYVNGSFYRLATLGDSSTLEESSLQWRYIENEYAISKIKSHPFIGLGLGANYRPYDPRLDNPGNILRSFIHNGHLWVMMTIGILGYLSLLAMSLIFIFRGLKHWRMIDDCELRGITLGFVLAYLGVFIAAIVNSTFFQLNWTPVIGVMMGLNEVIWKKAGKEA